MPAISIQDIFKISLGPSSSHTIGPWRVALDFIKDLEQKQKLPKVKKIQIILWNSLAKTGIGHGADKGILLGLSGESFTTINPQTIAKKVEKIQQQGIIYLAKKFKINFSVKRDLIFKLKLSPKKHPNQIDIQATIQDDQEEKIIKATYYSVGGGFIEKKNDKKIITLRKKIPYPIEKANEIIHYHKKHHLNLTEIILANELANVSPQALKKFINQIADAMIHSIYEGCHTSGILPGGLNVNRRASSLNRKLLKDQKYQNVQEWITVLQKQKKDFRRVNQFITCFALAVNEVNAAMGRIVTAPTNGAAGVIPAVFMYYYSFINPQMTYEKKQAFFLVSSEIGSLFKKNASISAAVGGCQAEIGFASAMAAAGLTQIMGGTVKKTLMAAEIAMEHHLGLTCDPIKGLVQIPCIERNSMGAIKAITASEIALNTDPGKAIVHLDDVIKTMWDTAKDMDSKYKETAEGGLAINIPTNIIEC